MARGINKVTLIGYLGRDPESKLTSGGTYKCKFSVATTESFKGADGNRQERTEWHRVVAWGKTAEICQQYLTKGSLVYIEGSLRTNKWEDQSGQKREMVEITVRDIQFLPSGQGGKREPEPQHPQAGGQGDGGEGFDMDIPF